MSPDIAHARLVRSCVIELVLVALRGSPSRLGAAQTLLRVAVAAGVDSEPLDILRAALALAGD